MKLKALWYGANGETRVAVEFDFEMDARLAPETPELAEAIQKKIADAAREALKAAGHDPGAWPFLTVMVDTPLEFGWFGAVPPSTSTIPLRPR